MRGAHSGDFFAGNDAGEAFVKKSSRFYVVVLWKYLYFH